VRKRAKLVATLSFSLLIAVSVVKITDYNNDLQEQRQIVSDLEQRLNSARQEQNQIVEQLNAMELQREAEKQQHQEEKRTLQEQVEKLEQQVENERANQWVSFRATYYDAGYASTGKSPGMRGYGITKSGNPVQTGVTVSVDPKVIPLGSWIEIKYPNGKVEHRRADDTGSAIKGKRLDIYLPKVTDEGVDQVKVRIVSNPPAAV
jgi:3D (Asp-Asp-Asp) domain-containing protein